VCVCVCVCVKGETLAPGLASWVGGCRFVLVSFFFPKTHSAAVSLSLEWSSSSLLLLLEVVPSSLPLSLEVAVTPLEEVDRCRRRPACAAAAPACAAASSRLSPSSSASRPAAAAVMSRWDAIRARAVAWRVHEERRGEERESAATGETVLRPPLNLPAVSPSHPFISLSPTLAPGWPPCGRRARPPVEGRPGEGPL